VQYLVYTSHPVSFVTGNVDMDTATDLRDNSLLMDSFIPTISYRILVGRKYFARLNKTACQHGLQVPRHSLPRVA
jgi:hypothetical protein